MEEKVKEVFDLWVEIRNRTFPEMKSLPVPKLTPTRKKEILKTLKDGYTVEQIRQAVEGAFGNDYCVEKGWLDIGLICRNIEINLFNYLGKQRAEEKRKRVPKTHELDPTAIYGRFFDGPPKGRS